MNRCKEYVGFECVNGVSCPMIYSNEYVGLKWKNCIDCIFNKGCEHCALNGTEYCDNKTFAEHTSLNVNLQRK